MGNEAEQPKRQRPRGTGCVYQREGSSNWWIQYYRNGKVYRQSASTTKRGKAEQMLQRKLAEVVNHTFIDPKSERTLVKLAEDFLRDYRINGRKSLADVEARWRLHLSKEFSDHRAANVGNDQMTRYSSAPDRGSLKRDHQSRVGRPEAHVHPRCAGEEGLFDASLSTSGRTKRAEGIHRGRPVSGVG
jgi:hypothetical protein